MTTAAFEAFITETGLAGEPAPLETGWAEDDIDALRAASTKARALIEGTGVPAEIAQAIAGAYDAACVSQHHLHMPVAVRSSATGEDAVVLVQLRPVSTAAPEQAKPQWKPGRAGSRFKRKAGGA